LLGPVQQRWERVVQSRALLKRMGKFLTVGGLGTLVNTGILVILYHELHLTLVVASALATELTIGHNYLWNDSWTFGRRGLSLSRFVKFNTVSLGGQCITIVTLWLLAQRAGIHYVVANLFGIGLAVVWNFAINVRWTWGPT
jgi:dolichol-phosphate mannosyltransferase